MLTFKDFAHLPQVDALVDQLVQDVPGLILVTGMDPSAAARQSSAVGVLPSGRAAIFRILARTLLEENPQGNILVLGTDKDMVRVSRRWRRRVSFELVRPGYGYDEAINRALRRPPRLLIVEQVTEENVADVLRAAASGVRVLAQADTIFYGSDAVHMLRDWQGGAGELSAVRWVVGVQRLATLCTQCKKPATDSDALLAAAHDRLAALKVVPPADSTLFAAGGCAACGNSGRQGEVLAFDFFHSAPGRDPLLQASQLSLQSYVAHLALEGLLPLEDVFGLDYDRVRRTAGLLAASESALESTAQTLRRKLAELEAANRVLQQRTEALVSLQEVGQALLTVSDLHELGDRICATTRALCGADRTVLYLLHDRETAEILSVSGWRMSQAADVVQTGPFCQALEAATTEPQKFNEWPPGMARDPHDVKGLTLRSGLCVPLIAQQAPVGALVVHSTRSAFAPGHEALLQTFAQQAALAIQRAGLINQLQGKIHDLEAAQVELARKERMEQELALARQVQQQMLPRTFPAVRGYSFAARNRPARQVGGDFFDVIALDDQHFGVAIADVSDKGLPAALYMALSRSLLLAEARRESSPRATLASVNRLLMELGQRNMFVTLFYGVVERSSGRLTYARAGHDRPVLLRNGEVSELGGEGVALGLFEEAGDLLTEETLDLAPGDRLVLYTDGLTDVENAAGEFLGRARLIELLAEQSELAADELCTATFAALSEHQAETTQFDDMTLLIVAVD